MVTTADEYFGKLHLTLNENPPAYARLPSAENIYNIDAKTRVVDAPEFLGVERDHKSEVIYFVIDRKVDYMDLSQTCCVINYVNDVTNMARSYIVPFYDIYTLATEGKMLVPWNLDATALSAAGPVKFQIHFYKVGTKVNEKNGETEKILTYSLNTRPAASKVLPGMEYKKEQDTEYLINAKEFQILSDEINRVAQYQQLYWTVLTD